MSAHTPGPWKLTYWAENIGVGSDRPKPRECESIAVVPRGPEQKRTDERDLAEANARLIAAAPDLLSACRAAAGFIEVALGREDSAVRRACLAAIAKAVGTSEGLVRGERP